jgi:hypothetical protein
LKTEFFEWLGKNVDGPKLAVFFFLPHSIISLSILVGLVFSAVEKSAPQ